MNRFRIDRSTSFFFFYFFYWCAHACLGSFLGLYYEANGLSGTQIGLIGSLIALVAVVSSFLVNLIADLLKKTRLVLLLSMAGSIAAVFLLRRSSFFVTIAAASALFHFCAYPANTIADKLLLDRIHKTPERYSLYRLGGSLGYCAGVLCIGYLIGRFALPVLFPAFYTAAALCLLVILCLPIDAVSDSAARVPASTKPRDKVDLRKMLQNKNFFLIYGSLALWGITESSMVQFLSLHLNASGFSSSTTGVLIGATMLGEALCFVVTPLVIRKVSSMQALILSFVIQFLRCATLAWLPPLPFILLGQFIGGGSFSLIWSSSTQLINEHFDSSISNTAQGLKTMANSGIGQMIGVPLCGWLYQYFGSGIAFELMAWLCLAFVAVNLLLLRKK